MLYYGSVCCLFSKSQIISLHFSICGSFMKLFDTRSKEIVYECMNMFNVRITDCAINRRKCKFLQNILFAICHSYAERKLKANRQFVVIFSHNFSV